MDSLSQIVLGGALAAAIAPAGHRRAALLAGAALGTLPDLDSLPISLLTNDPVALMTQHRSFSHSLFVLPWVGWLIWWLCKLRGKRVAQSPQRWFWAIQLALITHPLLDAFTVYGTQLWWPLHPHPTMGSSVFIIDPLYTIWLLLACVLAWCWREKARARQVLMIGLLLSSGYLGWSLLAKAKVDAVAQSSLAAMGMPHASYFSTPMPFNTLLWRVVAMTPNGYMDAEYSLLADHGPLQFRAHASDMQALAAASEVPAVQRLQWFNRGFMRAQVQQERLLLSDLRMGLEPDYSFSFEVAQRQAGQWQAIPPVQRPWSAPISGWDGIKRLCAAMWQRIWHTSAQPLRVMIVAPDTEASPAHPAQGNP